MGAEDTRKKSQEIAEATKAEEARTRAEAASKVVTDKQHLLNHFEQLIHRASNKGKFAIDKVAFAGDRFSTDVVDDVVRHLKADGYKVEVGKNNALQQITFTISW